MNAKHRELFIESIQLPFVHTYPNGNKLIWMTADEVPDISNLPFKRTEIVSSSILAATDEFTLYDLHFQRYDEDDQPSKLVRGLWGLKQKDGVWRVSWRQYLGDVVT